MSIAIFRPKSKSTETSNFFNQQGLEAFGVPAMDFVPIHLHPSVIKRDLSWANIILCQSPEAAKALQYYQAGITSENEVIAIGNRTAESLGVYFKCVEVPEQFNSEGVLNYLMRNSSLRNKTVLILKGRGGRQFLNREISSSGAQVRAHSLYERVTLEIDTARYNWQDVNYVIATSTELLDIAINHIPEVESKRVVWIVISQRMSDYLSIKGISKVILAKNGSNTALLEAAKTSLGASNDKK